MDRIFETMECLEADKRRLATFQLRFAAADWWEAKKVIIGAVVARTMTWTAFCERFLKKFFPEDEKDQKEKEFMELTQGGKIVQEYVTQQRLSRFPFIWLHTVTPVISLFYLYVIDGDAMVILHLNFLHAFHAYLCLILYLSHDVPLISFKTFS